jgi:hypothetical protein
MPNFGGVSCPLIPGKLFRALAALVFFVCPTVVAGQSTQSTIVGTIRDASGKVVVEAQVRITSTDEGVVSSYTTDGSGDYRAANLKPGHYRVEVAKDAFRTEVLESIVLVARQELRVDATLQVGRVDQQVLVTDQLAAAIDTENATISSSLDANSVLNLPTTFRGNGGTSPLTLISILPGVQPDTDTSTGGTGAGYSVHGGLPSQSETTIDGISTQNTGGNSPLKDAFTSADSIAELRVDGVGNNAEFGQPGQITTISKSGMNDFHGGIFWYHQNAAFDAIPLQATSKPKKVGNDFGGTLGGPVFLPHLYRGNNKTFFFTTYEGFRFPKTDPQEYNVPTQAMRNGDFTGIATLNDPFHPGNTFGSVLPNGLITSQAQKILSLYPLPNIGDPAVYDSGAPNYSVNKDASYRSNQFDLRGDQYFGTKALVFARFSWKNINQNSPQVLLVPSSSNQNQDRTLALSLSYNLKSNLVNEFRFGFTIDKNLQTNPFAGTNFTTGLGLNGIGPSFPFNGVTEVDFSSLTSLNSDRLGSTNQSRVFQFTDNVSWTRGRHAMKFGIDVRKIETISPLGFNGADNYGTFDFSESTFTGQEFADFLLGLPTFSATDQVKQDNDGKTMHYHFYGQDTWQATPRLTLTYGLRYEFHPAYHDPSGNIGNFDPSVAKSGAVIYPDGKDAILAPAFLASFNACPTLGSSTGPSNNGAPCTPVLSNSQAHLPSGLREAPKDRVLPRFGFAFRPFKNDKTAIRGSFGVYNITLLGSSYYSLTGTLQSNTLTFQNSQTPTGPQFAWPDVSNAASLGTAAFGTAYFGTANQVQWKDPYSMQWGLSVEHELPGGIGARISYVGMKTDQLVWAPNYNDMSPSSTTAATDRPLSDRPFPNWGTIQVRANGATAFYNAMELEAHRTFRNGLTFDSSFTWAKNLADNQGPDVTNFAGENGGSRSTYINDRHLDFGDVNGTRRRRWLTSVVYDLPIGRGKLLGSHWNRFVDGLLGGWQTSGIFLWQSGPYLTPHFSGGDPSGTGSGTLFGRDQHPDRVGSWVPAHQEANDWINPAAFVCPGVTGWAAGTACLSGTNSTTLAPIGRFGNSGVGVVEGPGTVNLNAGLSKVFSLTERVKLKAGASFTNVLNHLNLADPNLDIASGNFGRITNSRASDFGGPRTGLISLRLDF